MAWLPREWALRPAFPYRVAIANALYIMGGHAQRLMPVVLAEAFRKNKCGSRFACCPQDCKLGSCSEHKT